MSHTHYGSFSWALAEMKFGKEVRLDHWSPEVRISIHTPGDQEKMTMYFLAVTSRYGMVPWIPTQVELLSEHWEIYE